MIRKTLEKGSLLVSRRGTNHKNLRAWRVAIMRDSGLTIREFTTECEARNVAANVRNAVRVRVSALDYITHKSGIIGAELEYYNV